MRANVSAQCLNALINMRAVLFLSTVMMDTTTLNDGSHGNLDTVSTSCWSQCGMLTKSHKLCDSDLYPHSMLEYAVATVTIANETVLTVV